MPQPTDWRADWRKRKMRLGGKGERIVARLFNGKRTANHHPVDVLTESQAIEVKTFDGRRAKLKKIGMRKKDRAAKRQFARENGKEPVTVLVVVYPDRYVVFSKPGFKNTSPEYMEHLVTLTRR